MIDVTKAGKLSVIYGQVYRFTRAYIEYDGKDESVWDEIADKSCAVCRLAKGEEYEDFICRIVTDFVRMKEMQIKNNYYIPIDPNSFSTMMIEFWSVIAALINGDANGQFTDLYFQHECTMLIAFAQKWCVHRYACDLVLDLSMYLTDKFSRRKTSPAA